MQRKLAAISRARLQILGHHREPASDASEAAILRETAELYRAFPPSRNLEDRMRDRWIADVGLIGCVEKDDGLVFTGIIDPARQLLSRGHAACRIIRKTEVNDIDWLLRRLRNKAVGRSARKIGDPFIAAAVAGEARMTRHDIRI